MEATTATTCNTGVSRGSRPRRRYARALPPVLLAVVMATGCMPNWTSRPAGGPRVAAAGDSIMRQLEFYGPTHPNNRRALTRSLQDHGWRASVRGENGWIIQWVRGLVVDAADRGADGVAIVAGANDVAWIRQQRHPHRARDYVAAQIVDTLRDLRRVRCVVWPTLPAGSNYYFGARRADRLSVQRINGVLRRQDARRTNLVVPEWGAVFDAHPEYALADGLHLSVAGEAALQDVLLDAMGRCIGPASAGTQAPASPDTSDEVTDPAPTTTAPSAPAPSAPTTTDPAPTTTAPSAPTTTAPSDSSETDGRPGTEALLLRSSGVGRRAVVGRRAGVSGGPGGGRGR